MYSWYKRINENGQVRLVFEEQTSMAGCNNGVIADELRKVITASDNPPLGWTLPIADKWNKEDYSFIIDIKPKSDEIFLCELDRVFGYTFEGWTPIMLRLKLLFSDTYKMDKMNFECPEEPEVIYTMFYLYGSFKDGKLTGTWNPPFGTITALLFWPEAMTFFYEQVRRFDPHFLNQNFKLLSV
ncbi:MAG: hypothetical protein JSS76_00430 [Bacteroidetes bacterium]|nr:hypothetical protein [Bacteroidota bacterium]